MPEPALVRDVLTVLGVWLAAFVALSYAFDLAVDAWREFAYRAAIRRRHRRGARR